MKKVFRPGFILPATILLGVGIAIMASTFLQFTASTSVVLNTRNYNALAAEAARSGVVYANSCAEAGSTGWTTLTPRSDCGGVIVGSDAYLEKNSDYRTTFSVSAPPPSGDLLPVTSTGEVEILDDSGNPVKTITEIAKTTLLGADPPRPIATGLPITDLKNDESDCAIANGQLYCWGANDYGQLGLGDTSDRTHPTLVQGALAGKTVTKISVGNKSACAVADGKPYCWGSNNDRELGKGTRFDSIREPTENVPITSSGPLHNKKVIDIGMAAQNTPFALWPFSTAVPHACAITEDGMMACWGDGRFRQLSGGDLEFEVHYFIPGMYWSYPDSDIPILVDGYANSDTVVTGKKAEKIGTSSHDSCLYSQGRVYCMGVEVPIPAICGNPLFPTGLFSGDWQTAVPGNACIGSFSKGYDMFAKTHGLTGYTANNKFADIDTFEVSTNLGCMMIEVHFVCVGNGPGVGGSGWTASFYPPWIEILNADITSHDNGDNRASASTDGLYCVVNRAVVECQGSTWQGGGGNPFQFKPIKTTADDSGEIGLEGKIATKVAAGKQHGCVIANGQLLCWGNATDGVLANGSQFQSELYAKVTGITSSNPAQRIGTTEGTFAADGPIAVGDGHSCATVNGQIYCWGRNDHGQLGLGNKDETYKPIALPSKLVDSSGDTNTNVFREISAGANHTCGISEAQLYCWGRNNNGQLGLGHTNEQLTPAHVSFFSGMRVQEVEAGDTGTCATANGHAYCWGLNTSQQLGTTGSNSQYSTPQPVNGGSGSPLSDKSVTRISMGATHACAVANADLYCWGSNANGRTGLNKTTGTDGPTLVSIGTADQPRSPNTNMRPLVQWVSAGSDFTCAVINAKVSCWGNNTNGQLGRGYTGNTAPGGQPSVIVPAVINNSYFATRVTAGGSHACGLLHGGNSQTNGNVYCWGNQTSGRVGNGANTGNQPSPTLINSGDNTGKSTIEITAGSSSTCAIGKGTIQCWGVGSNGRLGNTGTANRTLPTTTTDYHLTTSYRKGPIY